MSNFGEKLKALRKTIGKSQIEVVEEIEHSFGDRIRISQTTLSALEQRETAPRGEVLEILAEYFGVPITYFFEVEEQGEEKLDLTKKYLRSLKNRKTEASEILTHTNDNSANDEKVMKSLDNMRHWQPTYYDEDEYHED